MDKRKIIGILVCWFAGALLCPVFAQKRMTLQETIELATDSSLQAFSSKNLYLSSYWEYRSFRAARLPSLNLEMTPIRYNRDFVRRYDSEANIDIYRQQQSLYSFGNLSIKQNLDLTGGTFFIDSELGYMKNFGENTYSQFSSVPIRIGYSQSLFGFNSFKWEKKIEPLKYEKAKKKLLYNLESIAEQSTQYFFNLAMAQSKYDIAKENVLSSDTLLHIGMERQKIASISQADLLTLELDLVNARNTLKNAEIDLKRAMFGFVSFLNLDKTTVIELDLPERPQHPVIDADLALQQAKENHPDFLAYKQQILEAEREVERTQRSSNFDASVSASIGFNQVASDFSGVYKNPLEQDVVSIGIKIPLVDWGERKGRANMAKNNLNVTKISVQQNELSLEEDVLMTVNDFNVQQDLIRSAEEALRLANTAYEATKQRFVIGKADISSLTLALNRQKDAQNNYISALRNYWMSYYKIRKMTLYDFERREPLSLPFDRIPNF
ncbi:MAG: TolC family protein [Dysgonamonadaceae bacterium]|jgi:outer membrane protein TolC|nr:TolC family protein [Dysgonamonadaceae bacterium]